MSSSHCKKCNLGMCEFHLLPLTTSEQLSLCSKGQ